MGVVRKTGPSKLEAKTTRGRRAMAFLDKTAPKGAFSSLDSTRAQDMLKRNAKLPSQTGLFVDEMELSRSDGEPMTQDESIGSSCCSDEVDDDFELDAVVVDPNPITRQLVVGYLRRLHCCVRTARPEGLSSGSFSLAVLSADLRELDAILLAREAKRHQSDVVIVLAGPTVGSKPSASIDHVIQIPTDFFRLGEIVDSLKRQLNRANVTASVLRSIDASVLEQMLRDDPSTVREVIEVFIGQIPDVLVRLTEAHTQGDMATLASECRELRTGARAVGANHLARLAHAVGDLVQNGDLDFISGFIGEMEREYRFVFRALMHVHASCQGAL